MTTDLASLGLAALARALAEGELGALEVTRSRLAALETRGRELGAVVALAPDAEDAADMEAKCAQVLEEVRNRKEEVEKSRRRIHSVEEVL